MIRLWLSLLTSLAGNNGNLTAAAAYAYKAKDVRSEKSRSILLNPVDGVIY